MQSCPRRRWSLCDEPTDAVGNSGRTGIFILGSRGQLGQQRPVGLLGHAALAATFDTPIATGEMLTSFTEHCDLIRHRAADFLNVNEFVTLHDATEKLKAWRDDYNHHRPHGSLGNLTPNEFVNKRSAQPNEAVSL